MLPVAHQLVAQADARGNLTRFEYDDLGRQVAVINAEGKVSETDYDKVGNVIAETDELGNTTRFAYDGRNRQIEVTNAENETTLTAYDDVGNVLSVTDPVGNTTAFEYDKRDRLIAETNELGNTRSFEYDDVGNRIAMIDRNGRVREFVYDGLNRQTQELWLDESGNPLRTIEQTYDAAGQLVSTSSPNANYTFEYDLRGRLESVDNSGTPGVPAVVLDYEYDTEGNLLTINETIAGEVAGVTNYDYDSLDRVTQVTQTGNGVNDKRVDLAYDEIGQFETMTRYADLAGTQLVVESDYSYDSLNRLERLEHNNSANTVAFYDFVYDEASRLTQITDVDGTTDYTYDEIDQLVGADHSDGDNPDESYQYDANGNREGSHLHSDEYVTGENNRLESDGTYTYEYDPEGNLVKQTEIATGEIREYEWDYRNRLVSVIDRDENGEVVQEVNFTYDPMNRRLSKEVDVTDGIEENITYFVYHEDDVWLEFEEAGSLTQRYLHGPQVDQVLVQEEADGSLTWLLTDHLGTVKDLVDSTGNVLNHIVYDSYGNVVSESNAAVDTRYLFTGREWDEEIELYYYRARYY